jgi:8-oxo-dGTP diphosphatase
VRRRPGSGNGFVTCAGGHRHWGRLGAAGLLLDDGRGSSLLQHRAPWTHEGGTWSIPGGARDDGEDAVTAALRESEEEAGLAAADVRPVGWSVADHDGWTYTTVVATVTGPRPSVGARNTESSEIRWWTDAEVTALPLHAGFAAAWAALGTGRPRPLAVVVDVANVMGSRPDGWWRDRAGAATRWWADLTASVRRGWAVSDLPAGLDRGALDALTPRLVLVFEGQARSAGAPATSDWADRLVHPVPAQGSGDDAVVAEAARLAGAPDQLLVVTSDRVLRDRVHQVAPSAVLAGPGSLPL